MEIELQSTQHIEGLAVLAGGIAHDFNNLLGSILGNANLVNFALPADSPIKVMIDTIEVASLQAADLTKQLLAYSGSGVRDKTVVDLSKMVDEMGHVLGGGHLQEDRA